MTKTRRGPVLVALLLAAFIINLDTTIVNVALPSLVRQLGVSTTDLQWIVDAYNLVFAAMVAVFVPPSRDPSTPPLDIRGLILSAAGMGTVVFSVIEAPNWGWGSAQTVAGFAIGLLLLAAFAATEHRILHPMLDVRLF